MNIVLRVDASITMGTGHVMRCRTLATALQKRGAHIQFIIRAHPGHLGNMLARDGFAVTLLPEPADIEKKGEDYAAWLGVSQQEDADQTIAALENQQCDWLIVDHYGLDRVWESQLQSYTHKLMVIDDLANRQHECDVLLDQNYTLQSQKRYQEWVPEHCQLLLGPGYALLRPEYAHYRETMTRRMGDIKRVLVFMGGADNANITGKVLVALSAYQLAYLEVDVVIGPNFIHKSSVIEQANTRPNTHIHAPRSHLADLMVNADLAIGAGGSTTWERMCMGLPSIVLSIAENQVPTCEALASSGLILYLGSAHNLDVAAIESALLESIVSAGQLRALVNSNQVLVDGWGVNRVAEVLIPTPVANLTLRPANANDVLTYFSWVNNSVVKSSPSNLISIDMATHLEWFGSRLKDMNSHLYVIEAGDLPVGQVRFERHGTEATINYSLDELVQGRGWSNQLVKLGMEVFNTSQPSLLRTLVNTENITPAATFFRLGFEQTTNCEIGEATYSIAILSDQTSWLNDWLPEMIIYWLNAGHRVLWTHQVDDLQSADFCFYLSFSKIVPKNIRTMFKNNLVVHESDLPQGKGWSPLTWQILESKNKISVTMIEADDKVDSGVIYAQEWIQFEGHELIDELRCKQALATINLCKMFVDKYPFIAEHPNEQLGTESFYPKRRPEDSLLDVNSSLANQFNLLRIVDNQRYPAFFELNGKRYILRINRFLAGETYD